jgi:hypothetical protein
VGPRADLDDVEKRKFLTLQGLNSDPSVVQPVASRYTDSLNMMLRRTFLKSTKVDPLYEPGYVIRRADILEEEKYCVCPNFPLAYEYQNMSKRESSDVLTMT